MKKKSNKPIIKNSFDKLSINKFLDDLNIGKNISLKCGCCDITPPKIIPKAQTGKINYIPQEVLDKLDPYLASIIGYSYINFDVLDRKWNIYFPDTTNPQITENLKNTYPETTVVPWSIKAKDNAKKAITLLCDLLNITPVFTNTYNTANIVFLNLKGYSGGASASSPWTLDLLPWADGKSWQYYNYIAFGNDYDIGSFFYNTVLHELGHTINFGHPFDTANVSKIMPGSSNVFSGIDQAFFYTCNMACTVMAYNFTFNRQNDTTNIPIFPRNYLPLDIIAFQYLYKFSNIPQKYVDNWVVKNVTTSLFQSLVSNSPDNGIDIVLSPGTKTTDIDTNTIFNLCLDRYNPNPMINLRSPYRLMSYPGIGGNGNSKETYKNYSVNILEANSSIKSINCGYKELNLFFTDILFNVDLSMNNILKQSYTQTINIYLVLPEENFDYYDNPVFAKLQSKNTNKFINFYTNNQFFPFINIFYGSE